MINKALSARILRRIRAMLTGEMEKWETREGIDFLKTIGIEQGLRVIEFGCGVGHYSIPAAVVTGPRGTVYAIDQNRTVLDKLKRKAEQRNLANLKTIRSLKDVPFEFEDESADVVLLYDMLHYLPADKRRAVYMEAHRVLKDVGVLSVYPKHLAEDHPADHFNTLTVHDLTREIQHAGFAFADRVAGTMSHDNSLVQGYVLNFRKKH